MDAIILREILSQLAAGDAQSGQALAERLRVSRSTVWNAIHELERLGLDIYAVRGKGYRLTRPLELLDPVAIAHDLSDLARDTAGPIRLLWQTTSTNAELLAMLPATGVCLAEMQTHGRGRRGRVWISPPGGNIYLSQSWSYPCGPMGLHGLSLACAVAMVRALAAYGVTGLGLKWPNDIQLAGAKLAGLLLEIRGESAGPCQVVAGVGLNIHMSELAASGIDQAWASLQQLRHLPGLRRNYLAALMINHLTAALQHFDRNGLGPWLEDWRRYDAYEGRAVILSLGAEQSIPGIYRGIDSQGNLLLDQAGKITRYAGGEVSLR